jgi:hypothetical protein
MPFQGKKKSKTRVLSKRISKIPLLRRLCQVTGVALNLRDFNFEAVAPFNEQDFAGVNSIVKGYDLNLKPSVEVKHMIDYAKMYLESGMVQAAWQYANEAINYAEQISGHDSIDTFYAYQICIAVMSNVKDYASVIDMMKKSISICVKLYGIDSREVFDCHNSIARFYGEIGNHNTAITHYNVCMDILSVAVSPKHPMHYDLMLLIANEYNSIGDYKKAYGYALSVKQQLEKAEYIDLNRYPNLLKTISSYVEPINPEEAVAHHKHYRGYVTLVYGTDSEQAKLIYNDERELFKRMTIRRVKEAQIKEAELQAQREIERVEWFPDEEGMSKNHNNDNKKNKNSKKKGKKKK